MTATSSYTPPELQLHIQYATPCAAAPRAQVEQWVQACLEVLAQNYELEAPTIELTLRFCNEAESQRLNRDYRQQDQPTNVLTFAYGLDPSVGSLSADIVICVPVLHSEAKAQGKSHTDHAAHLCVHGVLHALGFDHIDDQEALEMEALEAQILQGLGISNPYNNN